ncbi:hypothetical protein SAMN05216362_16111 [Piscibacillus halophilus]|uniref:Uncharacterized protein n=1 Tax=Piscibacillus halophilus TaxID=571933 RepID=A0A1H9MEV3_9BACI|nr:hypothetical protein SAMN05216362_16111 [Piscibacillus halophilus]
MMFLRFLMIGLFSFTAMSLMSFQGVEIFHAFVDLFKNK